MNSLMGPLEATNRKTPHERRFWRKVAIGDGCWNWQAKIAKDGYGVFSVKHRDRRAPRVAWELVYGIPPGGHVLHHCDNPACVRPSHLYVGTHRQNMRDRSDRKRTLLGTRNHKSKLTEAQVLEIRAARGNGERQVDVGRRYGVSQTAVMRIQTRRTWRFLEDEK